MVWLFLDSYHDRRTGYEFGVNPSGVKLDAQIYNDGNEAFAWDAVWDAATRRDSLGWTAEFRIPLSQLRYGRQRQHTFGLTIDRDLYRYSQRVSWPLFRQSKAGFVSQFGDVPGFEDLEARRRLEAAPCLVTKNVSEVTATGLGRTQDLALGGDVTYRVASNLASDATLNPDFGQVEAGPAILNLSAFETFFREQRPFFVAGRGLFQFDVNCNEVNCNGEGLVYSRRIGRAPELAGTYNDNVSAALTRILRAGELTGRLPGWEMGNQWLIGPVARLGQCPGHRFHAARRRALLPASGRGTRGRRHAHIALRRRRGAPVQQGERQRDRPDQLPAPLPRIRDQRSGLPAARRPAVLEHLGGLLRPQAPRLDPALPVELQLVAILDHRRPAGGACVQHQHAHHVQQHVVVPHRFHPGPAG